MSRMATQDRRVLSRSCQAVVGLDREACIVMRETWKTQPGSFSSTLHGLPFTHDVPRECRCRPFRKILVMLSYQESPDRFQYPLFLFFRFGMNADN